MMMMMIMIIIRIKKNDNTVCFQLSWLLSSLLWAGCSQPFVGCNLSSLWSEEALAAMAGDSNMQSNEVIVTPVLMDDVLDRLSAIQSRYGTDEETRRIETMLERYD